LPKKERNRKETEGPVFIPLQSMKKNEGRLVGILGTVIFHLIAAIIFMSFKLRSVTVDKKDDFTVEFIEIEEDMVEDQLIELPVSTVEKILQGDAEMLNIARNLANRPEVNIDPEDYIDMVKNELIKDGKLDENNYIDEQKRLNETNGDDNLSIEEAGGEDEKPDEPAESQKMAADYQGPTRIYYDLEGRIHTYLPLPIYKCRGAGKVVMRIEVSRNGIVESAQIIKDESTTDDICLIETAVKTALISRFNADDNAAARQTGTLTYHFVAQ